MTNAMKMIGVILVAYLGVFRVSGQINNLDFILNLSANLMTNPQETTSAYWALTDPYVYPANIRTTLLTSQRALNISMIDVRLVLQQTKEFFGPIFAEHFPITGPLMKTPLTGLMDSYIQALFVLHNYISNVNNTLNPLIVSTIGKTETVYAKGIETVRSLETFAASNNVTTNVVYMDKYEACIASKMNAITLKLHNFILQLIKFKRLYPDLVQHMADCLLQNDSMDVLWPALSAAVCLGNFQVERFEQFYEIINGGLVVLDPLAEDLVNLPVLIDKCALNTTDAFYRFLSTKNVVCPRSHHHHHNE